MAGGAGPAVATEGGQDEYEFNFWNTISPGVVPVFYGVLAVIAWYGSPTAPGIAQIELYSGIALILLGVAGQGGWLKIGGRQDYFGGLGLVALALFALWASRDLPGMRGFAFGPGTAPRIRPLGLVVTCFLSIFVSAFATSEVRWLESLIWAAVLAAFCSLLFPWGLNLPIPLWPTIDIPHALGLR
jgi:putative tricarboxylic transport membrane protein